MWGQKHKNQTQQHNQTSMMATHSHNLLHSSPLKFLSIFQSSIEKNKGKGNRNRSTSTHHFPHTVTWNLHQTCCQVQCQAPPIVPAPFCSVFCVCMWGCACGVVHVCMHVGWCAHVCVGWCVCAHVGCVCVGWCMCVLGGVCACVCAHEVVCVCTWGGACVCACGVVICVKKKWLR